MLMSELDDISVCSYRDGATYYCSRDNLIHRDNDLPAIVSYENGSVIMQMWYNYGRLHRDGDLPSEIIYHKNGKIKSQTWSMHGKIHRNNDLPTVEHYDDKGNLLYQKW